MLTAHIRADLAGVQVQRVVIDSLAELVFAARETGRFPAYARCIELNSATGRALNVVKMRNSNHRKDIYQFELSDDGPAVGGKLEGVTQVLGWSVLRTTRTTTSPPAPSIPAGDAGKLPLLSVCYF